MAFRVLFLFLFMPFFNSLFAQGTEYGVHSSVIRGQVSVDFEQIFAGHVDSEYPLDTAMASLRALEEAAMFFSAMIYGWSFSYEPGERARRINESLELTPLGEIQAGDPALKVTDVKNSDSGLSVWMDYNLSAAQQNRMGIWRSGSIRTAQAVGYSPARMEEYPGWLGIKKIALEDAARAALRAMLRGSERNRPKEVTGFISLTSFPRYFIDSGRWGVSARFRVQVVEIVPFSAY